MANDLNRCDFIGRLGADPETRYTSSGNAVTNIRIACGWKSKDKEGTEWVPIVFFGKLAEIAGEYLKKGAQVYVSGQFKTRKWQDKDGQDKYTTEVIANQMQMLGGKSGGQQKPETAKADAQGMYAGGDDFDDMIPF